MADKLSEIIAAKIALRIAERMRLIEADLKSVRAAYALEGQIQIWLRLTDIIRHSAGSIKALDDLNEALDNGST